LSPDRRIYLIRHGKADRKSHHRADTPRGPAADPPLDATGLEQAQALARRLARMPDPAAIYCSTLTRARQTIEPYIAERQAPVTYLEELVEWHAGRWEFKEFEELLAEHPEIPARILLQDPMFFLAPGGETLDAFQERVVTTVERSLDEHLSGDLWFVCHGGVINAYIGGILGIREQDMFFLPANASISTVIVRGDERLVWFLSDDSHVVEPELFPDP
jgi:probable phosphoglycerate mutase